MSDADVGAAKMVADSVLAETGTAAAGMLSMAEHAAALEPHRSPALPPRPSRPGTAPMVRPTPANAIRGGGNDTLTAEHCAGWRSEGFALVEGVWPAELIAQAASGLIESGQMPGMGTNSESTPQSPIPTTT